MLRLTWAQMRRSLPRLMAAGVAIVIGTAFVAVTLLAGNLISRSVYDQVAAPYAQAGLVVQGSLDADALTQIRATPGVAAADALIINFQPLTSSTRTVSQLVIPTPSDPRLTPLTLTDGEWPVGDDQIALPPDLADRLGVEVGDTLTLGVDADLAAAGGTNTDDTNTDDTNTDDTATGGTNTDGTTAQDESRTVTVSGIVDDPAGAYSRFGGAAVRDAAAMTAEIAASWTDGARDSVIVALADSATVGEVRTALTDTLRDATVQTPAEVAEQSTQEQTGGQNLVFLIFVLTFAAIALLVAGLVISNTFQVLVAQRTRTLALLRAVGASKRQVGQGVLVEATLLGAASSALGVLVGCALAQGALTVAQNADVARFVPDTIVVTWPVVVLPVVVGTAVTVLAALVPARMATRVAPLAALRPIDGPTLEKGSAGRVRLVLTTLMTVLGFVLLAGGAVAGTSGHDAQLGLLSAVAGGALSFVGVVLSAVFWLPRVASWSGRLVGLTGPTARLAAANTLRNPRRTAATSTALLIGVTLVATMSAGAASARHTLTTQLDSQFPVDVQVQAYATGNSLPVLSDDVVTAVEQVDGVLAAAPVRTSWLTIERRDASAAADDAVSTWTAYAITAADAAATINDAAVYAGLGASTVVVPEWIATSEHIADGDSLTLRGDSGTVTLTAVVNPAQQFGAFLLTPENLAKANAGAAADALWVSLPDGDTAAVGAIRDAVADTNDLVSVTGAALERADYEKVIDIALGIVVGLLAVAVVIALIGVANTLSLSVLERRRESATLRAIGVTRGQLRRMLAVEGMLIAGVGAVLGIVLGLAYGWAGSLAGLGVMGPVELAMPWRDVALVAVIALAAGLVASVAPGRSAARPSPVVALAAD